VEHTSLKKFGDFWIPDVDARWGRQWLKSHRLYRRGRGPKVEDIEEALGYCDRWAVALDGGANIGAYSRVLMQRFERVIAFEPAPDTFACLARNLQEWGGAERVELHQNALSDRRESVSLGTEPGRRSPSRRVMGGGNIEALRIDDLELQELSFLKIDVEGYEERALRGAEQTLQRCQPLVMFEDKPKKSRHFGDPRGAHHYLESIGMKPVACIGPKKIDWLYRF
jgi:FkbM family methyltransferase